MSSFSGDCKWPYIDINEELAHFNLYRLQRQLI
jgi:hypothetical protein